jgi:uncharacterized protein YaeQ
VIELPEEQSKGLASLVQRSMALQCTVQDGEIWLSCGDRSLSISLLARK